MFMACDKRKLYIFLMAMAGIIPSIAQNENSFETFRKEIKDDFGNFRKKILDDYDNYLEGIWIEYNAFRGKERNPLPKPKKALVAESVTEPPINQIPTPNAHEQEKSPLDKKPTPVSSAIPIIPSQNWVTFDFYSISVKVPEIEFNDSPNLFHSKDFASLWRIYSRNKVASQIIPALQQCATTCSLNDWFVFELVRNYANYIFPSAEPKVRISIEHYLLNHLGYDVRIGVEDAEQPILLVAFEQMVYARTFTEIEGQRYYLFHDSRDHVNVNRNITFKTCELPKNIEKGYPLDLIIHKELTIPYTPYTYTFSYGNLKIKGGVNSNLMPMLYRYPQIPIGCYAQSIVNESAHNEVVEQLRHQLAGIPQSQAVDELLQFVQNAFDYATDDEQHGFEKPYFFEETLFYPFCDCEDRSIFYSYLLWEVLGVENQLIEYTGHATVAVHLNPPIQGDGYFYEGRNFYISDPTYINAVTGMCMSDYLNEQPIIDFHYRVVK